MSRSSAPAVRVSLVLACLSLGIGLAAPACAMTPNVASDTARRIASQQANRHGGYANASTPGMAVVVVPGEIKSGNASFRQMFGPNNIADFGELELARANFKVLDRQNLGAGAREFELALAQGDAATAARHLQKGALKTTRWIVRFDVLKAEHVAAAKSSFDGATVGALLGVFGMGGGRSADAVRAAQAAQTVSTSIRNEDSAGVWQVGLRYTLIDANTTEQRANGYVEDTLELGAQSSSVLGMGNARSQNMTLDSMVQRLVQQAVAEIDRRHK